VLLEQLQVVVDEDPVEAKKDGIDGNVEAMGYLIVQNLMSDDDF
ncbi:hypothetical protein Tco_1293340, partial [Tanacetum coccineum]